VSRTQSSESHTVTHSRALCLSQSCHTLMCQMIGPASESLLIAMGRSRCTSEE